MTRKECGEATSETVRERLRAAADPEKAAFYPKFFKAHPGGYGEGDQFFGVVVPEQRKIAKSCRNLAQAEIIDLLEDPVHECRLTALFILIEQYKRGDEARRQELIDLYLAHLDSVNNWDLVDASASKLLGRHLELRDRGLLYELANGNLWRQRVAMIACLVFIKNDDFDDALTLTRDFLEHPHDLMHKACGWMLREIGKRDLEVLEGFLIRHVQRMPRTMLRYAIERLPEGRRQEFLRGEV